MRVCDAVCMYACCIPYLATKRAGLCVCVGMCLYACCVRVCRNVYVRVLCVCERMCLYACCALCLGDMWPEQDGVSEPDWVRTEREQFKSFRDKDGDGRMDSSEVREWVMPDDYDHTVAESKHLIFESDMDRVRTVRTLGPAYNEFGYIEQIFPYQNH